MTQFLDLRLAPVGGGLAASVSIKQNTGGGCQSLSLSELLDSIRGRNLLLVAHGYNVNRAKGMASLSNWESLLQLPQHSAFLGLLWPGDSVWAHGLDYPEEPKIADEAGTLLASFIDANFQQAASISFASHSLGARVVLAIVSHLRLPVRRVTLMAPAIDDNCLTTEFQAGAAKAEAISVLASKKDEVLSVCFPLGNLFAGIIAAGHPWWRAALGLCGPAKPWPKNFKPPFKIPDEWKFQHGNYLQIDHPPHPDLLLPVDLPPQGSPPLSGIGWQEAFSSAFASTRFR
jgi:pimeloyl-ACP methyl ester carboxylesterase